MKVYVVGTPFEPYDAHDDCLAIASTLEGALKWIEETHLAEDVAREKRKAAEVQVEYGSNPEKLAKFATDTDQTLEEARRAVEESIARLSADPRWEIYVQDDVLAVSDGARGPGCTWWVTEREVLP